jgi:predicted SAM-dependent methyltransferase
MLGALVRNLLGPRTAGRAAAEALAQGPLRLHIGGHQAHPDWKIVNINPGVSADYVRSCTDLSPFADGTVAEIYASHVLEHLGYQRDLRTALKEFHRVLVPGGVLRLSVPDLTTLCTLFLDPALDGKARFHVMRMMFGGQVDPADFHFVGISEEFMTSFLNEAGFADVQRVEEFGLFDDASSLVFAGARISLNVIARKSGATHPDTPVPARG